MAKEETAPVEDEPAVAPSAAKVEGPAVPAVEESEKSEVKEPEVAKEEAVVKEEPGPIVEQKAVVPAEVEQLEDPEDVRAREEIARLNAEVMRAAEAEDVE